MAELEKQLKSQRRTGIPNGPPLVNQQAYKKRYAGRSKGKKIASLSPEAKARECKQEKIKMVTTATDLAASQIAMVGIPVMPTSKKTCLKACSLNNSRAVRIPFMSQSSVPLQMRLT